VIIYLLRNKVNGKCYVGKTTCTLQARWRQHKTEARIGRLNSPLYQDLRAHGPEAFEVSVLVEAQSQRRLNQLERKFIAAFKAVETGYNLACESFGGRPRRKPVRTFSCSLPLNHREKIAESVRLSWIEAERKKAA
jgi:group I intron endonuclease